MAPSKWTLVQQNFILKTRCLCSQDDSCESDLSVYISHHCMSPNKLQCTEYCLHQAYSEGHTNLDYEVCPLQYFCNCTCLEPGTCERKCRETGLTVRYDVEPWCTSQTIPSVKCILGYDLAANL